MLGAPPVKIEGKTEFRPKVKQYPLKPDAEIGITPVIDSLLKAGVIIECPDVKCMTPIFPVKKAPPSTSWRMVQDLRAVNNSVQQRAPNVPNPHTLLNSVDPKAKYFTVIDMANAFFSIPLTKEAQQWFGFTFKRKTYTFTRLPQGYCESPTIYSQCVINLMSKFEPKGKSQVLIYVDDILLTNSDQCNLRKDTIDLLKFLQKTGNKVSKEKLQLWKTSVKYLGHTLSQSGRTICEKRKSAILQTPLPQTKKQLMSFLGLCNYCRAWIIDYALITKPLSALVHDDKEMSMTSKLIWTPEAEAAFCMLKQTLVSASVIALPDYAKPFVQMCDVKNGFMTSVLCQNHGSKLRPVAYYSTQLDPVARATPPCVQAVIAAAMAVQASAEVVLFHPLTLKVPHAVSLLLLQTNMAFLSPSRHLMCMATLLSQPHLVVERCTALNPSTLMPTEEDGTPHNCSEKTQEDFRPRPDLKDQPLSHGQTIYIDGSAGKNERNQNQVGYAITTQTTVLKTGKLPSNYSAQAAELVALIEACKMYKGESVTIYTDSQYAFGSVHHFCKQWKLRGFRTAAGKDVAHRALLEQLLHAITLPKDVAVCKCAAHTAGTDDVSTGNRLADEAAKKAALLLLAQVDNSNDDNILQDYQTKAPNSEKTKWKQKGCEIVNDIYVGTDGKPWLPRSLYKWAAELTHGPCHVSTRGMVDQINKHYHTIGFNTFSQIFCKQCLICIKNNPQGAVRPKRGAFPSPPHPFHTIHMDYIQLNKIQGVEYCLVIIDAYSKWVEMFPTAKPDALTVAKALCKTIIPTFGIPNILRSDNGSHFVNDVINKVADHFKIDLKNHAAYHPQSAGLVERTNGTIKNKLCKASKETGRPWPQCIDLVKLNLHILPAEGLSLTPFEILYGRPYTLPDLQLHVKDSPDSDSDLINYMRKTLETRECKDTNELPREPLSPQNKPVVPGDHVFIKVLKRKSWNSPRWEGPFRVTLSTPTAVKVEGRSTWIHLSHCKQRELADLPTTA